MVMRAKKYKKHSITDFPTTYQSYEGLAQKVYWRSKRISPVKILLCSISTKIKALSTTEVTELEVKTVTEYK